MDVIFKGDDYMAWIFAIVLIGVVIYFITNKKPPIDPDPNPEPDPDPNPEPEPLPDPVYYKWQLVDTTTDRWKRYIEGMKGITSDTLMALEMIKTVDGKKFYVWTAETGDYWDLPDEVYEKGKVDCDGFARLTSDGLARFAKYPEVWWMEYYGYYRKYIFTAREKLIHLFKQTLNFLKGEPVHLDYIIVLGGHAITVYVKDGELLAFSNTQWWHNKNFQDYIQIGEMTFPEGLIRIRCRHWDTGILQWVQEAEEGEILAGSCIFNRDKKVI